MKLVNTIPNYKRFLRKLAVILCFVLISGSISAQTYRFNEGWMLGGNIGLVSFFGDLSVQDWQPVDKLTQESDLGIALLAGKQVSRIFTIKASYLLGKMKGENPDLMVSFRNEFNEISLSSDISILKLISPRTKSRFDIYANLGIGYLQSKAVVRQMLLDTDIESPPVNTSAVVVLTGLGAGYRISPNWKTSLELTRRLTGNDLIDGHEGTTTLINDYYSYLSVGLTYIFKPAGSDLSQSLPCSDW